jgi:hypothetical protein
MECEAADSGLITKTVILTDIVLRRGIPLDAKPAVTQ